MKFFRRKLLSGLLVFVMLLSVMPATAFAAEATTVSTEQDLRAAIEAIPEGGSGEITIENIYMYLNEGLYIENKDITFNLVSSALVTAPNEDGSGQPVIFGFGTNITINMDDNSSIQAMGHTGNMGVVRIDNSTDWNETTKTFEKTFALTINGGQYTCSDKVPEGYDGLDRVFVAAPGTKVVLTDIVCNGIVEEIDFEGVGITVPGELIINGGKFVNDVSGYAAAGKYAGEYDGKYYVRDKEFSDDFSKPLTNGKIVFNYAKPSPEDEALWLISEDFCVANPDFYLDPEGFNEDFTKLELGIHYGTAKEEFHLVDVVWDYDADVLESAQTYVEKFPEERPWFNVSDLELVNYWVYHNPDSEIDSLANYSGELKSIFGNGNFLFTVEVRGGGDAPFYTERIGSAKLIHDGKVYFSSGFLGARAEHAIYVAESTADTKEALIAAAQKRIDDYIGKNVIKITASEETVTDYYNSEMASYDEQLATAQRELAQAQATLAAEQAKDQSLWDWNVITNCQLKIMECESDIENIPTYKQYFVDQFEEDGDLHFLKKAAGDFFFNVEVVEKEETYTFVIIKEDDKLEVPSHATVDLNTNISVSTDSSTVPLDTVVEVEKLTEGADYERIITVLDVEENETFDIKLHSASLDKYVTKLEDGMFKVKLPIPEKFKGKTLIVYYVDENNKPIEYEAVETEDGKYVVFATDHFSIYTLAEKADSTPQTPPAGGGTNDSAPGAGSSPQTADNTSLSLWMVLLFIGCGLSLVLLSTKGLRKIKL